MEQHSVACFSRLGGVVAAVARDLPDEEPVVVVLVSRGEANKEAELSPQDAILFGRSLMQIGAWLAEGPFGKDEDLR